MKPEGDMAVLLEDYWQASTKIRTIERIGNSSPSCCPKYLLRSLSSSANWARTAQKGVGVNVDVDDLVGPFYRAEDLAA